MTEKRFTIDVETENYENAYFENDKFLCYEDDYDTILKRLNELAEENKGLKQEVQEQERRKWACLKEAHRLDLENKQLKQSNKDAWNLIRFIYNEIKEDGSMDWWRIQDLVEFEE